MNFKLKFNRFGTGFKLHSPEILLVSGLVEGCVGTVLACVATRKICKCDLIGQVTYKEDEDNKLYKTIEPYERTKKEKIARAIDICKAYAPAAGFGIAGVTSICASHGIMRKRYAGLLAAYGTLTSSFMEYRNRVREEVGEKREEELYYGLNKESIQVKVTDKDGKERKVNKKLDVLRKNNLSPYSQKFDPAYSFDETDPYYVDSRLVTVEQNMNDLLKARGHVYLNDIRKELGLDCDDVGQVVGWLYDPQKLKDGYRDNQIHIIKKIVRIPREEEGFDVETWLDFNVDGVILGKMSKEEYNTHIKELGDQGIEFSNKEE